MANPRASDPHRESRLRRLLADRYRPLGFLLLTLAVYAASTRPIGILGHIRQSTAIDYAYLAEAFLHGRADLAVTPDEARRLIELVPYQGRFYVVYPPMPAVLLMPFVGLFGRTFRTAVLSILLAGCSVALTYVLLRRYRISSQVSTWVTALFGFGTCFWYTSLDGSSWYLAHVTAVFFLLLALVEAYGQRRPILIGAAVGAATLARLPVVLATPFFLYLILRDEKRRAARVTALLLGVAIFCAANMAYNWVRYRHVLDIGYVLIPGVLDEPWYDKGILHLSYLPRNLYALLFQPPLLLERFPYVIPTTFGLSLLFTTPALLLIFAGRGDASSWALALTSMLVALPGLLHGWPVGAQFGYRFSLDYTPFLMLLTARGMGTRVTTRARALIILSCAISLWGLRYAQWIAPTSPAFYQHQW
jgi:hypothetical protein